MPPALSSLWSLDPSILFLNHGSFGACPRSVLNAQQDLRDRLERQPVQFLGRDLEPLLDQARASLAAFVGAEAADLAFVPNATTGVNAVLRSLKFSSGDELLTTDHAYNACRNALEFVASSSGASVVVAPIPFPTSSDCELVEPILDRVGPNTRLVLIDHISSPTALIFPVERLVRELDRRGVDCLVDGAHAPGMLPLNLESVGAAWYAGNCHKWLCAPKGAGFLHVRRDKQALTHPVVISHGSRCSRTDRSAFRLEFDWTGTDDPTPFLCVPIALDFFATLLPGGWAEVQQRNRSLARQARDLLCEAWEVPPQAPDSMLGSMATMQLPAELRQIPAERLQALLLEKSRIEVPFIPWEGESLVRISAQLYNSQEQYEQLARAVLDLRLQAFT